MTQKIDIAEDGTVTGTATISLESIVDNDLEWLLDEISLQVTGTMVLQDFSYDMESINKEEVTITFTVKGHITQEDIEAYGI